MSSEQVDGCFIWLAERISGPKLDWRQIASVPTWGWPLRYHNLRFIHSDVSSFAQSAHSASFVKQGHILALDSFKTPFFSKPAKTPAKPVLLTFELHNHARSWRSLATLSSKNAKKAEHLRMIRLINSDCQTLFLPLPITWLKPQRKTPCRPVRRRTNEPFRPVAASAAAVFWRTFCWRRVCDTSPLSFLTDHVIAVKRAYHFTSDALCIYRKPPHWTAYWVEVNCCQSHSWLEKINKLLSLWQNLYLEMLNYF